MFDKIVESVLNEISAEDAYRKFYSALPEQDYFNLVKLYCGNKNKFDNIIKTVLNSVRDGICDMNTAASFVTQYKSITDNNIRVEFNSRFNNGDYEDVLDMIEGLKELTETGVTTLKQMQDIGIIKVCHSQKWSVTCTTTYSANHHFFGKTSWCTASDRFGRYDGWDYFRRYIFCDPGAQSSTLDREPSEVYGCLVQFTSKEDKSVLFQAHINEEKKILLVCNAKDDNIPVGEFINMDIDDDNLINSLLNDVPQLVELTAQAYEKERGYQNLKNDYVAKKRAAMQARFDREFEICVEQAKEANAKKMEFVRRKFDELYDTNLVTNVDFLNEIVSLTHEIESSFDENEIRFTFDYDVYEQKIKSLYYSAIDNVIYTKENPDIIAFKIRACMGKHKEIDQNGRTPHLCDSFTSEPYSNFLDGHLLNQTICVIAKIDNINNDMFGFVFNVKEVIYVKKERNEAYNITTLPSLFARSCDCETTYFNEVKEKVNIYAIRNTRQDITYLTTGLKEIKLDFRINHCIISDNMISIRGTREPFLCLDYQLNVIGKFNYSYSASYLNVLLFNEERTYFLMTNNGRILALNYKVVEEPKNFFYYSRQSILLITYYDFHIKDVLYSFEKNKVIYEENVIGSFNKSLDAGIMNCTNGTDRYKIEVNNGEIHRL